MGPAWTHRHRRSLAWLRGNHDRRGIARPRMRGIGMVLVAAPNETLPLSSDDMVRITESATAESVVSELAQRAWRVEPRGRPPGNAMAS